MHRSRCKQMFTAVRRPIVFSPKTARQVHTVRTSRTDRRPIVAPRRHNLHRRLTRESVFRRTRQGGAHRTTSQATIGLWAALRKRPARLFLQQHRPGGMGRCLGAPRPSTLRASACQANSPRATTRTSVLPRVDQGQIGLTQQPSFPVTALGRTSRIRSPRRSGAPGAPGCDETPRKPSRASNSAQTQTSVGDLPGALESGTLPSRSHIGTGRALCFRGRACLELPNVNPNYS